MEAVGSPESKRTKKSNSPEQPMSRVIIDVDNYDSDNSSPVVVTPFSSSQPPKEKEELNDDDREEEEEEEVSTLTATGKKKKGPTNLKQVIAAHNTLDDKVSLMKTRLERLLAVSFALNKGEEKAATGASIVEWDDEEYGPQRTIEEIKLRDRYGGVDQMPSRTGATFRVKTPLSVKKVQCVPYYLLAEQVQANTRLLRLINERVLPALDPVVFDTALMQRTLFDRTVPATIRDYMAAMGKAPVLPQFPLLAVPARLQSIPDAQLGKASGVIALERKAALKKAAEEMQMAQEAEGARRNASQSAKTVLERDSVVLKGRVSIPAPGQQSPSQQQQQQVPLDVQSLPDNWAELETEEKLDSLASIYYQIWNMLKIRLTESEQKAASFEARLRALEQQKQQQQRQKRPSENDMFEEFFADDFFDADAPFLRNDFLLGNGGGDGVNGDENQ